MTTKFFSFILLLLLLNSTFIAVSARPLNIMKYRSSGFGATGGGFVDGLSLGAIKQSGPSPGEGNKLTNKQTLGGIKNSGPSPVQVLVWETNSQMLRLLLELRIRVQALVRETNFETLGGIKDSGPSPGTGNKFTNVETLSGIKDSGPSPGTGNKFTDNTHQ
ncbi:hypothetical protein C1H46_043862 [Malus baccata]|uniref:Legume lectin domain-containing protein n=1 Tax=Malus baccata TaxID=106549 RepID=A0A540K8W7_MALBA|nr:hypothetical protein C1H46_043862 [Malus baccata]